MNFNENLCSTYFYYVLIINLLGPLIFLHCDISTPFLVTNFPVIVLLALFVILIILMRFTHWVYLRNGIDLS